MPERILVVEYEPRYTDRVRQALAGQPYTADFAKDGEEALRAIELESPNLIVVSSVLPKIAATELIRTIRTEKLLETPILLTVSGYAGTETKADAQRVGASDILPKPYSETQFLGKVRQMLAAEGVQWSELDPSFIVKPDERPATEGGVTADELFGELLDEPQPERNTPRPHSKVTSDVDELLAATLAGMLPQKKKDGTLPGVAPKPAPKPKTQNGQTALDKLMEDTLSGLEKTARSTRTHSTPPPAAAPAPPPQPPVVEVAAAPSPVAASAPAALPAPDTAPAPAAAADPLPGTSVLDDEIPTVISKQVVVLPPPPAAPPKEEEPLDGIAFGQYVLLEKIATGGMAEVWRARMRGVEGFQKIVAIKKILPHLSDNQEFIEMFVDEAKLAAQLSHTNIVHIFDLGRIQSSYFIAMEYVDGLDLKTILKRAADTDQPMQVELALFVASKIASALDYAHRKRDFANNDMGLVHRDVSPQNVLISFEGDIKLCDFGIAKAASKASHTQTGALKGKLQYMSPEQASGVALDRRSDVFSLAAVLFEMLTRRKLFAGDSELSILDQVREARVTAPSLFNDDVTPEVDAIVLKALAKDPDRRYQTAAELARDIDQVLYSLRPTPTSADLAIYMHRLSSAEPIPQHLEEALLPAQPPPVEKPAPAPQPATPPRVAAPKAAERAAPVAAVPAVAPLAAPEPFASLAAAQPKKLPIVPIALALIVAAAIGAWYFMRPAAPAPAAGNTANAPAATATTATSTAPATTSAAAAQVVPAQTLTAPTTQAAVPAIDPAKVDEEVRKRLEQERLRLEAAQRQQAAPRSAPAQPAVVAPPPVQIDTAAAAAKAAPAAPAPAPAVAESRPAPAPEKPSVPAEQPKAREGDLVQPGTDGLVPARIVRQAVPLYPPMARQQRVEGTVLMSVLVSEKGEVLDVRVLSGVNRPVGINEAALQTVRRSSFAPGTKDGAKVKSWTTVSVIFKL